MIHWQIFESYKWSHKRNLFCLPRQKGFFLAFWAKKGRNQANSGFKAVNRLQRSPIFSFSGRKKRVSFRRSLHKQRTPKRINRVGLEPRNTQVCSNASILSRLSLDFTAIICYNIKVYLCPAEGGATMAENSNKYK